MTTPSRLAPLARWLLVAACGVAPGPAPAPGQETPPGAGSTPSNTQKVADLTARYRFAERYTTDEAGAGLAAVGSYRVAVRDVYHDSVEAAQGAPRRTDSTRQAIFAERPAEMSYGVGNVASTVRVVEKYQVRPEDAAKGPAPRPLDGTTVLVRPRSGDRPLILSLTEGRSLTEQEFDGLARMAFVPHLSGLLPAQTVRLGDAWRIPRKAAQALLGDPSIQGDTLVGKLAEVRKEVDGPRMVASIAISGKAAGGAGETVVNAEVLFTFQGTMPAKDGPKKSTLPYNPAEDTMTGRGAITEIRLASVASGPVPGPGRLRFQSNRELTLHRQLGVAAGGAAPPLVEKPPEPTEANSWLAHVDASGRYSLLHPQELLPPEKSQAVAEPNTTLLTRSRREGRDMLQVEFFPKTLAPDDLKKAMAAKYALMKMELIRGDEAWLPEADWRGVRVHRVDAALKVADPKAPATGAPTRIHFDGYLVQFAQSASILAIASTSREAAGPFRDEVERILKTIKLDPPRPPAR